MRSLQDFRSDQFQAESLHCPPQEVHRQGQKLRICCCEAARIAVMKKRTGGQGSPPAGLGADAEKTACGCQSLPVLGDNEGDDFVDEGVCCDHTAADLVLSPCHWQKIETLCCPPHPMDTGVSWATFSALFRGRSNMTESHQHCKHFRGSGCCLPGWQLSLWYTSRTAEEPAGGRERHDQVHQLRSHLQTGLTPCPHPLCDENRAAHVPLQSDGRHLHEQSCNAVAVEIVSFSL